MNLYSKSKMFFLFVDTHHMCRDRQAEAINGNPLSTCISEPAAKQIINQLLLNLESECTQHGLSPDDFRTLAEGVFCGLRTDGQSETWYDLETVVRLIRDGSTVASLRASITKAERAGFTQAALSGKPWHRINPDTNRMEVSHDGAFDLAQTSNSPTGAVIRKFLTNLLESMLSYVRHCRISSRMNNATLARKASAIRYKEAGYILQQNVAQQIGLEVPIETCKGLHHPSHQIYYKAVFGMPAAEAIRDKGFKVGKSGADVPRFLEELGHKNVGTFRINQQCSLENLYLEDLKDKPKEEQVC